MTAAARLHSLGPDRSLPVPARLRRALACLRSAGIEREVPLIVAGGGVLYSEAEQRLKTFAEAHGIPVAETQGGEILQASYGARLWQGSITVRGNAYSNLDLLMVRVALLQQAAHETVLAWGIR